MGTIFFIFLSYIFLFGARNVIKGGVEVQPVALLYAH